MPSRRRFLTATALSMAALAGCTDDANPGTPTATDTPRGSSTPDSTPSPAHPDVPTRWTRRLGHDALTRPRVASGPDHTPTLYVGRDRPRKSTPSEESFPFYALSLRDGTTRWQVEFPDPVQYGPLVKGSRVYVATGTVSLHGKDFVFRALDVETGEEVWTFDTDARRFLLPLDATEETVIVGRRDDQIGTEEPLYALAADDGTKRWQATATDAGDARFYRGTLFFWGYGGLRALDPKTGDQRWSVTGDHVARPAFHSKSVVVNTDDTVRALALEDGTEQWARSFAFTVTTATDARGALDDNVYVGDYAGRLLALSPLSGETRWISEGWNDQFRPTPRRSGGALHVASRTVRSLDPVRGTTKWTYGEALQGYLDVDAGPDTVFVDASRTGAVAALAPDGTERWMHRPENYTGVETIGNTALVTAGGALYALDGKKERSTESD